MEANFEKIGATLVLFIIPDTKEESRIFSKFTRCNEPLTAELKQDVSWGLPYMEIVKEVL